MAVMPVRAVVAPSTLFMDRARPSGGPPGPNQLRIPTPQDLVRMRQLRQQQQQQQQQLARQRQRAPLPQSREQSEPFGIPRQQIEDEDEDWEDDEEEKQESGAEQQQAVPRSKQPAPAAHQQSPPASQQQATQWRLGSTALPPSQQQQQQQQLGKRTPVLQRVPMQPRVLPPRSARQPGKPGPRDALFAQLAEECGLEDAWRPQVLLLYELGLRTPDFERLAEARPEIFQMGVVSMRRKLKFFRDAIGLSDAELTRVITKFPRILEYKSERTIRPRLDFLRACGVEQSDLAKVFMRAPMALELRVRDTLEPRAAFLRDVLCLSPGALGKLIVRHPQVLTCTQEMMQLRVDFLRDQGLGREELGRAVLAHPQVLHYKIDSMRERVSFLRGCGLDQVQVAACCARFPQIFSLNVEANLAPKWRYLVDYIRAPAEGVATLCSYPAYFSLSLTNRVVPRHRYFLHVHAQRPKAGRGGADQAFAMSHLKCSDAQFAKLCGRPLEDYERFKAQLFGDSGSSSGDARLP